MYKECPSLYKECPSSSSSVQGVSKQCTRSAQAVYKECPSLYTGHAQIGHWLGHVYISKQFPSLGTLSVTAWTQLVRVCEQVSFQVALCFSMHVGLKTSVNVVTTVALYVSACMHVGVKTSVNVVTAVALYVSACMHVGLKTSVNVVTSVALYVLVCR